MNHWETCVFFGKGSNESFVNLAQFKVAYAWYSSLWSLNLKSVKVACAGSQIMGLSHHCYHKTCPTLIL